MNIHTDEQDLQILTKKSISERKNLLKLFSKLTLSQQKEVFNNQRTIFHKLKNQVSNDIDNSTLSIAAFIISIANFINSLNQTELNIINFKKSQKELKTQKLLTYWSVVKELKEKENISFRGISKFLKKSYKFKISYSLIYKVWIKIEEKEANLDSNIHLY